MSDQNTERPADSSLTKWEQKTLAWCFLLMGDCQGYDTVKAIFDEVDQLRRQVSLLTRERDAARDACQTALDYSTVPAVKFREKHGSMTKGDLLAKLLAAVVESTPTTEKEE